MIINAFFCIDLMQTLKSPFEVPKDRLVKYVLISCIVPILIVAATQIVALTVGKQKYP